MGGDCARGRVFVLNIGPLGSIRLYRLWALGFWALGFWASGLLGSGLLGSGLLGIWALGSGLLRTKRTESVIVNKVDVDTLSSEVSRKS